MKPWLALLAALLTVPGVALAADDIAVHDAWVRAAPPGATVLAAYLTIDNHSASAQALSGASSPQFERVEIHRTEIKNGVASMSAQPRVAIPAHGTLSFAPDGYHLMLIGPRKALHTGDHVELRMQFDGHPPQLIHAPVRADAAPADDMMQQHHHD
jgi:periplasmic copper chaperone A